MTARLPVVAGDSDAWGTILNDFLGVAHNSDGSIKNLFVNVADPAYGASPSNTAAQNDTAIAAAIAALPSNGPGVLLFPSTGTGVYSISASVIIDRDNVTLMGFGTRTGAPTLFIASNDPTYALIVGNTKNVNNVVIDGLNFVGKNSTSSTGGGINFRCVGGKIRQSRVANFGGTGINVAAFSSTIFEVFLEDVLLVSNGMNTGTPGDNLVIANTVTDSEYHRVISLGGRHGINNSGGAQKFIDCHPYTATQNGFFQGAGTGNTQIIGGEYETNGNVGIKFSGTTSVHGATCFGNTVGDLEIDSGTGYTIVGNVFQSAGSSNNLNIFSGPGVIADNSVSGNSTSLYVSGASVSIHDNVLAGSSFGIFCQGTTCAIHDNTLTAGSLTESTGANNNDIHDNFIPAGKTITIVGAGTAVRNNPGYNPVGQVTAPGFPSTTVAATNTSGRDVTAYIANGTSAITVIQVAGVAGTYVTTGMQIAANGWGSVRIPVGGGVKFTYGGGSPTWTWMGE